MDWTRNFSIHDGESIRVTKPITESSILPNAWTTTLSPTMSTTLQTMTSSLSPTSSETITVESTKFVPIVTTKVPYIHEDVKSGGIR